jgi:hypothetical protein
LRTKATVLYLKDKIDEHATKGKSKKVRDMYRGKGVADLEVT